MSRRARLLVLPLVGVLLLGCSRKAPSPETCAAFTELLFNASHEEILQYPEYKAQFDLIVVTCLTEPFDARVFTCTAETRKPRACLERFGPRELQTLMNGRGSGRRRGP